MNGDKKQKKKNKKNKKKKVMELNVRKEQKIYERNPMNTSF